MKIWTIYCHTHIESGRRYIGLTRKTMLHRWNQHVVQARSSRGGRWHFPNAIRKYGPDAFSHEVLAQSWTLELANAAEEELILQYDTRDPGKGFNLAKGGQHKPHTIRKNPWDSKLRTQMSEIIRRSLQRPEVLANRSAACKKNWQDAVYREKVTTASKRSMQDPLVIQKISVSVKASKPKVLPPRVCKFHGPLSADEYYVFSNGARKCKYCSSMKCALRWKNRKRSEPAVR